MTLHKLRQPLFIMPSGGVERESWSLQSGASTKMVTLRQWLSGIIIGVGCGSRFDGFVKMRWKLMEMF